MYVCAMKHRHIVERDLRSEILDVLRRSAAPVQLLELSKALGIPIRGPDYEALCATPMHRLNILQRER
jgi:hypothetical protein